MAPTATNPKSGKKGTPTTDWRVGVLRGLNAPVTATNLSFLTLWQRFEGGPADNPLNTSLNTKNVTGVVNSSGVKRYNSPQAGVSAIVQTLQNTKGVGYEPIVSLLRSGKATAPQLAEAVTNSKWDAGHYHAKADAAGTYVGGSLVNATLGPLPKGPSALSVAGDVAHYATHPLSGLGKTGTAAENVAKKPLDSIGKYVLYGGAIAGGGALMIVGFVLIAADIGLHKGAAKAVAKTPGAGSAARYIGSKTPKAKQRARDEATYRDRSYRSSREGIRERKVRVKAGPNATKMDRKMEGKTRTVRVKPPAKDEIPF